MNHCVAIRTNWTQVVDWVDYVAPFDLCDRNNVVDVDFPRRDGAINLLEVERTHRQRRAEKES
jgi:hypothetical protein